jgi:hypothetical protein
LIAVLVLLGPRTGIVLWWLADRSRWDSAWDNFIVPVLGFLFLPWTTLMFVAVAPFGNVAGWDWLWLALALVVDLGSYGGGGYGNRGRIPGYARR